jgi:hypothetical protein
LICVRVSLNSGGGILQPNHRRRGCAAHRHAPPPPFANLVHDTESDLTSKASAATS